MARHSYLPNSRNRRIKRSMQRFGLWLVLVLIILGIAFLVTMLIRLIAPDKAPTQYFVPTENVFDNPSIVENIVGGNTQAGNNTPVGPVMQEANNIKLTSLPASSVALAQNGRVDTTYFNDAVFVGDSLTEGLTVYTRSMFPETTTFLYKRGINPLSFMTGTWELTANTPTSPLQDVINANAGKIYIMLGLNGISSGQKDDVIIKYYEQLIAELKKSCPNSKIYVQSILPVGAAKFEEDAKTYSAERIKALNEAISQIAYKNGVYYLNLYEAMADENGYMQAVIGDSDGFHMKKEGYLRWVEYLVTHTAHSPDNPYLLGSPYYVPPAS